MLFYMIKGANVTFRHFLFMYPPLVFMAVYALGRLCNHKRIGQIVKGGLAFQTAVCVALIIVGHPFQTTYFNILAGKNVAENFQYINTDYYKEALEQILKLDSGNNILVSSDNLNCYYGIKQAWEILSPKKKDRIQIAEPETEACDNADYHVYGYSTLVKENMEAEQGITGVVFCEPEKKFNSKLELRAYGKCVIEIFYNKE